MTGRDVTDKALLSLVGVGVTLLAQLAISQVRKFQKARNPGSAVVGELTVDEFMAMWQAEESK